MKRICRNLLIAALVVCCLVGMMVFAQAATEKGIVTSPKTGVAYKLGIDQTNKGEIYYFTGEMSGYYGASETSMDTAVDVYVEAAPGGYYLTFKDASGAKKYITMVQSGTHYNFTIADSASTVYTYDAQYNTFVTELDGGSFYMGTYNNFVTFGFSKYSYIATSFPAHLYTADGSSSGGSTTPTTPPATTPVNPGNVSVVSSPKAGTGYKFGFNNGSNTYYFTGAMAGNFGATSTDINDAVTVYLESVSGGYQLYFKDGSTKTYIYLEEYIPSGSKFYKASFELSTTKPSTYFTFDSDVKTLIYTLSDEDSFFMGTYGSYTTISASDTYYITGANAANVDKTQYPARLYAVEEEAKPLTITKQPTTQKVKEGLTAKFTVTASGEGLKYQWQYRTSADGKWATAKATGNTTKTLSVPATTSRSSYQYRCKITDSNGKTVYTNVVNLYVLGIKTQPVDKAVVEGKTAKFTVKATGASKKYQWQYRSSADGKWSSAKADGNKTATLSVPASIGRHGYEYRCKITDSAGNVIYTEAVSLYVLGIKTQPVNKTVKVGATAKFTVAAVGKGVKYQWQYRATSDGKWSSAKADGNKTRSMSVPASAGRNGYQYRCKITDAAGNVIYSNIVKLTVKK